MRPITTASSQPTSEPPQLSAQPPCPVCSGLLVELRGFVRCSRCHFAMCAGCEGEPWGTTSEQ
jgi:hypothetical protein